MSGALKNSPALLMREIFYNRFVVVYALKSLKPGRYDAFIETAKRLGRPYSFGSGWFLLKSHHCLADVTERLGSTIRVKSDRLLVLQLEHGKRPTMHATTPQTNFTPADLEYLTGF